MKTAEWERESGLQGRRDHRDLAAPRQPFAQGLRAPLGEWHKTKSRQSHDREKDCGNCARDLETQGGLRPGQNVKDIQADVIACLDECHAFDSRRFEESLAHHLRDESDRRRASMRFLDEVNHPAQTRWPEVPKDRLCPSGVPNEAMARSPKKRAEVQIAGWFPLLRENNTAFHVHRVTSETTISENRRHDAVWQRFPATCIIQSCAFWNHLPRLKPNARFQAEVRRSADLRFDISSHSRNRKCDPFGKKVARALVPVGIWVVPAVFGPSGGP